MFTLTYKVAGAFVTNAPWNLSDKFANRPQSQWTYANVKQTADSRAFILTPIQETSAWSTASGKLQTSAWTFHTPANWEQVGQRGTNDWFMHSRGVSDGFPVTLNTLPDINQGFCFEFIATAASKTLPTALYTITFGQYFTLVINGDGTTVLSDSRTANPIGAGQVAPGSITGDVGKFLQVFVLPMAKAQRILVWSSLGEWFSSNAYQPGTPPAAPGQTNGTPNVGLSIVTQSAPVTVTPLSGQKALWAWSALQFPTTGSNYFTSPVFNPPAPIPAATVITNTLSADQEFATTATMALNKTVDGSSNVLTIGYTVTLVGVANHTPVVYKANISVPRTLSTQTYTTDNITGVAGLQGTSIGGIIDADITLSSDRAQDSAEFILDNPTISGVEKWTSLKDLQNRGAKFSITASSSADPDWAMVQGWGGGSPIDLFDGFGTKSTFTDAAASKIRIECQGQRKKVRKHLLNNAKSYDGMTCAATFTDILQSCGYVSYAEALAAMGGIIPNIYCVDDGNVLDQAQAGDDDDLWQPADGTNAEDFLDSVALYFGYEWTWVQGTWVIVPLQPSTTSTKSWFALNQIAGTTVDSHGVTVPHVVAVGTPPTIWSESQTNNLIDPPVVAEQIPQAAIQVNPGVLQLSAIGEIVQDSEEPFATDIYVIGVDVNGNPIVAYYSDESAISDNTATNYVGDRWLFIYSNAAITSAASAASVLAKMVGVLPYAVDRLTIKLPDFVPQLQIGACASIENYRDGVVKGIKIHLGGDGSDRYRQTEYTVQLVPAA